MARKYFCAYHSLLDTTKRLNDAEFGRLMRAAIEYSATGEPPTLGGRELLMWDMVAWQIDRDLEKYNSFVEKQSENGKKGGRPKKEETQKTQAFSEKPKKAKTKEKENKRPTVSKPPLSPLEQAVEDFKVHRKAMEKPMTPHAVELMLSRLDQMAPGDDDRKIAMLHQSIERGWVGVFDLKESGDLKSEKAAKHQKPGKYKNEDFTDFFTNLED